MNKYVKIVLKTWILILGMLLLTGCVKAADVSESEATVEETVQYSARVYPLERNGISLHLDSLSLDGIEPEKNILLIHATYIIDGKSYTFDKKGNQK